VGVRTGPYLDDEVVRLVCHTTALWPVDGQNIPNSRIAQALAASDPEGRGRGEDQVKNWRVNNFKARACMRQCAGCAPGNRGCHLPGAWHVMRCHPCHQR
jgi:hypothetical protein